LLKRTVALIISGARNGISLPQNYAQRNLLMHVKLDDRDTPQQYYSENKKPN